MIEAFISKNGKYFVGFSAVMFGLFVFIPFKFKPYLVVLIFLLAVLSYSYKKHQKKTYLKKAIPVSSLYIIVLASLIYTQNLNEGLKIIGRMAPLLLPLAVCYLSDYDRNRFFYIFKQSFVISCSVYSVLIFIYLNQLGCFSGDMSLNYGYSYIMYQFWGINDHPIYISTYFVVALFFLLFSDVKSKILSYVLFIILFAGLLVLSRKGSIISFLLCTILFFVSQRASRLWLKGLFIIAVIGIGISFLPEIKYRFFELFSVDKIVANTETSTGIRYIVWKTSVDLITNAPVFGYGIGDVQDVLNASYNAQGYEKLAVDTYNAHNQFLQIALASGLLGLFIFLGSGFVLCRQLLTHKNFQGFVIFVFFLSVFLTESYLERQNGIIMYSFIMSMCIFKKEEL